MKKLKITVVLALILAAPLGALAQTKLTDDPAYLKIDEVIDLQIAKPQVNVNLPKFLLNNVVSEFDGGDGDPFAQVGMNISDLIKDIKLIRVMVIESSDESRSHLEKAIATLRKDLERSWLPIVNVPEDNVGIYALSDSSGEQMAGLALLVADGGDIVVGNVVGNLPIGKILKLAASMGGENQFDFEEIIGKFAGAGISDKKEKK